MDKTPQSGTRHLVEQYDLVVAGGGMAGLCCAIQGAREGLKTCLIQDRPVLGGVASSEMRVTVHGAAAHHAYARETGILSEIMIEERRRNHEVINENGWTNSIWDMVLYDWVLREKNLTLKLNTNVVDLILDNGKCASQLEQQRPAVDFSKGYGHRHACNETSKISALLAITGNAQTKIEIRGQQFVDCTGDAVVADMAGCEWRWGSESQEDTGEYHAPKEGSTDVMGNSIHIRARKMAHEVPFEAPEWAIHHEDASFFYEQGRVPHDPRGGYWWIEIGVPYNTIYDNEEIRHELTRHALGVWDWMKNKDPKMKDICKNYALEFIGQVPGKRENRRVMGEYLLTEHDIQGKRIFEDEIAFGGWFLDLHTPGGLLAGSSEPAAAEGYSVVTEYAIKSYVGPYGLPLRSLISKDISNLAMAGRNVSVTHAALGTVRVMATTALMGQALGTAIAIAQREKSELARLQPQHIVELQQSLLRDGCFLPNVERNDRLDLAPKAKISASSTLQCTGNLEHGIQNNEGHEWSGDGLHQSDGKLSLDNDYIQLIPVDGGKVEEISFELESECDTELPLLIYAPTHIWDYDVEESKLLLQTKLMVKAGVHVISCPVNLDLKGQVGYLHCRLGVNAQVKATLRNITIPGAYVKMKNSANRSRIAQRKSMVFGISPTQRVFEANSLLSGSTRPQLSPNRWMSEITASFPQSLCLEWSEYQKISTVELTFPGHLLNEFHSTKPQSIDTVIPKDFSLEVEVDGQWKEIAKIVGNYQRKVKLNVSCTSSQKLRLNITATNGSPMAQVSEIRVY